MFMDFRLPGGPGTTEVCILRDDLSSGKIKFDWGWGGPTTPVVQGQLYPTWVHLTDNMWRETVHAVWFYYMKAWDRNEQQWWPFGCWWTGRGRKGTFSGRAV